ncbi:hypothetical protein PIB30_086124, partial [Stylosanthes scabra]|nr:hypothetical protein [Stylosanthes scabra]
MTRRRGKVKPECRVGLPRVVLLAYLLGFWRFIRTENPWVGDSHSVCFSENPWVRAWKVGEAFSRHVWSSLSE